MLARRVVAISPDQALAKLLGTALKAAGATAHTYASSADLPAGEISAALVVVHICDSDDLGTLAAITKRLDEDASIVAVVTTPDLRQAVAAMQASDRVAAVVAAQGLTPTSFSATATRLLHGDIFGLDKYVPWGTRVYSTLAGDYQEKSVAIAEISEFAKVMGVRRKFRELIEKCADEMLMNALYDAPVDSQGKPRYEDVPTKTRISLRMEQKAIVQFACDGQRFALSVRDSFGSIARDTVIRYLHKCLHAKDQINQQGGGAGLGIYIMSNSTTEFTFNVLPGVATECVCLFDLTDPAVELRQFGFFGEKIDAAGRLAAGAGQLLPEGTVHPVERRRTPPPPASRGVIYGLIAAIALMVALIVLTALPRLTKTPTSAVQIVTKPTDATIELDGRARGTTVNGEILLEDLAVGRAYRLKASRKGWRSTETVIEAVSGQTPVVTVTLEPTTATVVLQSKPPGATVIHAGTPLGTTPLITKALPAGQPTEVTFRHPGFTDRMQTIDVVGPGERIVVVAELVMSEHFGSVSIQSQPPGAAVYQNGELLAGVLTPVDEHIVQANKPYNFVLKLPGYMPHSVAAKVKPRQQRAAINATLAPGSALSVTSNVKARLRVAGAPHCTGTLPVTECPVPNGKYRVQVNGEIPGAKRVVQVEVKGQPVAQKVEFGLVEATIGYKIVRFQRGVRRAAFPAGKRTVTLVDNNGNRRDMSVRVRLGRTIYVP